jgi:predicted dehydrogenase
MPRVTRRTFLESAAGAAVSAGIVSGTNARLAAGQPSNRVRVAVMGVNSRGLQLARAFARQPGAEVAAICDVDSRALAKAIDVVTTLQQRPPKSEPDVRRILDDTSIDALVIAAPDHWHAPATIMACKAGKHVYVEKPCSHNPREGELMVEVARRTGRLVQLGTQRRSWPNIIRAVSELKAGRIGRVYMAATWYTNNRPSIGRGVSGPPPEWLDYELWQGPAPRLPFKSNYVHYDWHWFWHWGTGEVGNNGTHVLDVARWGLGVDLPIRVTAAGGRYGQDDDWECPDTAMMTWEFADRKLVTWEGRSRAPYQLEGSGAGVIFHGEQGTMVIDRNDYRVFDLKQTLVETVKDAAPADDQGLMGPGERLDAVHVANFLAAIREKATLNAPIDVGHTSTLLAHLGNMAWRAGRVLHCDPSTGHIKDDAAAMQWWGRTYAPGWEPKA